MDLQQVDDQTARQLLERHARQIAAIVNGYTQAAERLFFPIDRDELVAIGEGAVLEAWATYQLGDESRERRRGAGFRRWAGHLINQRCSDYVKLSRRAQPCGTARRDSNNGVLRYAMGAAPAPDETVYSLQLRGWLRAALGDLPARQRTIIVGVARGESKTQLARELGVSRTTVHEEHQNALAALRERAQTAGLDGTALAGWSFVPEVR